MQSGVPLAAVAMKYIFLVPCRVLRVTKDVLAAAIILCKDNHGAGDTLQPIREHQLRWCVCVFVPAISCGDVAGLPCGAISWYNPPTVTKSTARHNSSYHTADGHTLNKIYKGFLNPLQGFP